MKFDFKHIQSAHCENGVTISLLKNSGMDQITEPLAFGIGAGLFYVYLPFIKINNGPIIAFRTLPGKIFKRTCKSLGISIIRKKFGSKIQATDFLNKCLETGHAVGCQVGVFYLPYFPKEYRFHFNAHNLIVYGRDGDNYLISDPIMDKVSVLSGYELERVRFSKGLLAPRGQLYYPNTKINISNTQIKGAIKSGVQKTIRNMLFNHGPFTGINGIRFTGHQIRKWRSKLGIHLAGQYLAQLVRMQEEIGTGGGGFRFIYAAFLQEAYTYHPDNHFLKISEIFTESGDLWRTAAVQAAAIYKGRMGTQQDFNLMGDYLLEIAEIEKKGFTALTRITWTL
ncbi:MAG: BtrH N-terminal domain-containing protein [Chitinophagaceae bacterium]